MPFLRRVLALLLVVCAVLGSPSWAASTCTVTAQQIDGRKYVVATIAETGARDTTEVTCAGVPTWGTIVSLEATLTAGTGTTIHPVVGLVASFATSTQDHVLSADATAAWLHEEGHNYYYSSTGTLYVRLAPNSTATDHAITGELLIVAGAP